MLVLSILVSDTSVRSALIGEDERAWAEPVVRSGQPIRITMRAVKFHQDTNVRRESSQRVRGLEYLRDHAEELSAR